jgi:hypothetical protein
MTNDDPPELQELDKATKAYRRTEAAHKKARQAAKDAVVAALKAGVPPTVVEDRSPFTGPYIRTFVRDAGVPPGQPGVKKRSGG